MPIRLNIFHPDRLVIAVCEDLVNLRDIEAYLDNVVVSGALPYRKIFDARNAISGLTDDDMMALGARIKAYANSAAIIGPMGPLALVAVNREQYGQARMFGVLAEAPRALKIFRDVMAAREWLDSLERSS
jgi:hypothetical protein